MMFPRVAFWVVRENDKEWTRVFSLASLLSSFLFDARFRFFENVCDPRVKL